MGVHRLEAYPKIKALLSIPYDEPIFILRAQDNASLQTLVEYELEAGVEGATPEFQNEIVQIHDAFLQWRSEHGASLKAPD